MHCTALLYSWFSWVFLEPSSSGGGPGAPPTSVPCLWVVVIQLGPLAHYHHHHVGPFFIFIFKKNKIQKYMSNREIFKNRCLSPPNGRQGACRPSSWRQDLNVKKFTFRSCAQGALNSERVKSI